MNLYNERVYSGRSMFTAETIREFGDNMPNSLDSGLKRFFNMGLIEKVGYISWFGGPLHESRLNSDDCVVYRMSEKALKILDRRPDAELGNVYATLRGEKRRSNSSEPRCSSVSCSSESPLL